MVKSRIMFQTITCLHPVLCWPLHDVSLSFDLNDSDTSQVVGQAVVIVEGVEMSKSAATRDRNVKH